MASGAIKALIFDFDGLILDTEWPAYQSWCDIYRAHGCEFTLDMWGRVLGGYGNEWDHIGYLRTATGRELDGEHIKRQRFNRKLALIGEEVALPGVLDYLSDGERLGLHLAVVSSSDRAWVEHYLTKLELIHRFETLVCAEDVTRVKPCPDLYLMCLERLGIVASEAVAFEDSPNGVLAARSAGIPCVAVPNRASALLPLPDADVLVESLADLPLRALLKKIGAVTMR